MTITRLNRTIESVLANHPNYFGRFFDNTLTLTTRNNFTY